MPRMLPRRWISLPNRDYWLRLEHRSQAVEKLGRHIWRFGTALFLFMFFAGLLTLRANLSDPVRLDERPRLYPTVFDQHLVFQKTRGINDNIGIPHRRFGRVLNHDPLAKLREPLVSRWPSAWRPLQLPPMCASR